MSVVGMDLTHCTQSVLSEDFKKQVDNIDYRSPVTKINGAHCP